MSLRVEAKKMRCQVLWLCVMLSACSVTVMAPPGSSGGLWDAVCTAIVPLCSFRIVPRIIGVSSETAPSDGAGPSGEVEPPPPYYAVHAPASGNGGLAQHCTPPAYKQAEKEANRYTVDDQSLNEYVKAKGLSNEQRIKEFLETQDYDKHMKTIKNDKKIMILAGEHLQFRIQRRRVGWFKRGVKLTKSTVGRFFGAGLYATQLGLVRVDVEAQHAGLYYVAKKRFKKFVVRLEPVPNDNPLYMVYGIKEAVKYNDLPSVLQGEVDSMLQLCDQHLFLGVSYVVSKESLQKYAEANGQHTQTKNIENLLTAPGKKYDFYTQAILDQARVVVVIGEAGAVEVFGMQGGQQDDVLIKMQKTAVVPKVASIIYARHLDLFKVQVETLDEAGKVYYAPKKDSRDLLELTRTIDYNRKTENGLLYMIFVSEKRVKCGELPTAVRNALEETELRTDGQLFYTSHSTVPDEFLCVWEANRPDFMPLSHIYPGGIQELPRYGFWHRKIVDVHSEPFSRGGDTILRSRFQPPGKTREYTKMNLLFVAYGPVAEPFEIIGFRP